MSKMQMALTGLLLLAEAPLVEAGQWIVVAAEQTSLQPGVLLDGNKPLKLAEGARLTLLAEDGKTLKLTGPYSGIPGGGANARGDNLTAIANLLQGHPQTTSTLGVIRWGGSSPPGEPIGGHPQTTLTLGAIRGSGSQGPATADLINVDISGDRCLTSDPVVLWRGNAASSERVTLLSEVYGAPLASFTWLAGETHWSMPGRYFEDGKSYLLQRPGQAIRLRVHKAVVASDNPAVLAGWMAKSGCKAQALSVLSQLTKE